MSRTTKAARHVRGLRNARYGEVLLVSPGEDGGLKAAVYNTLGVNDCPLEQWNALDAGSLAEEFRVPMVYLNGPRYWAIDELTTWDPKRETVTFGGLQAQLVAEVRIPAEVDPDGDRKFYVDTTVERDTEYILAGGRPVHALHAPGDRTYVLQAYSHIVDESLTMDSLATLGERLRLPQGWRYRVHTPAEDVSVRTTGGEAHVVQDELQNTYMLLDPAGGSSLTG
ncbi:hypothetical protein ACFU5O_16160 [Streptomyces sp. NPDC057445]|uniref:hypothetical protein n=1 Tax=Streptomyces sp. NPDC057445 TaxID=3346136 RepID=UPI0036A8E33F